MRVLSEPKTSTRSYCLLTSKSKTSGHPGTRSGNFALASELNNSCCSCKKVGMQYIQFLTPQPDDLAALLEALAAVFEVDAELWLDESLRYPILGQVCTLGYVVSSVALY